MERRNDSTSLHPVLCTGGAYTIRSIGLTTGEDMPEHRMINVPELDFMAVTENVTDWRLGKRVEIKRPQLSFGWGCASILALPCLGIAVYAIATGQFENFQTAILWAIAIPAGIFGLIVFPFNRANPEQAIVIDWDAETVDLRRGRRIDSYPFSDIERFCVETTEVAGETTKYRGVVDIDLAGVRHEVFGTLMSTEEQNKPCQELATVARRLAQSLSVPCEFTMLGQPMTEEELSGVGRSASEVAKNYLQLGNFARSHASIANMNGNPDEAEEYRQEAIAYYMQASQVDPSLAEPMLEIARLSDNPEHHDKAIAAALQMNPDSALPLIEHGRNLCTEGRDEEGLAAFAEAIAKEPSVETYHARGDMLVLMEKFSQAYDDFTEAIKLEPEEADCYGSRAGCLNDWYRQSGDEELLERALADYDEAIRLDEYGDNFLIDRSSALLSAERYDEAITDLTKLIQRDPDSFYAYSQRGQAYLNSGRQPTAAERDFTKALDILSKQPRPSDTSMQYYFDISTSATYRWRAEARRELGQNELADDDEQMGISIEEQAEENRATAH